jgi:hypothetical protein
MKEMLQYPTAESLYHQVLQHYEEYASHYLAEIAKVHYLLAQLFWNQGRFEEAEPHCSKSLAIREQLFGSDDLRVRDISRRLYGGL